MDRRRNIFFVICILLFALTYTACSKPKNAKIEVSEHEFSIKKISDYSYSINVQGKIRNIGETDVKKIVVTGFCRTCSNGLSPGKWTISERERAANEMDIINYLVVGGEADFHFEDLAVMYNTVPKQPETMPDNMEVVIQSFEIVDQ